MVRNLAGGTKTKGLARKHQTAGRNTKLRVPEEELEHIVCVTKMLGNGMCEIFTNNNVRLICHIPGKFRGKNKRHNLITPQTIVLVGLREWEKIPKNCDLLTVYDESHVKELKTIPSIDMDNILKLKNQNIQTGDEGDHEFEFSNKQEEEEEELPMGKVKGEFKIENTNKVDIDDI